MLNNILRELINNVLNLGVDDSYDFQHDNDPKHTHTTMRLWLLHNI